MKRELFLASLFLLFLFATACSTSSTKTSPENRKIAMTGDEHGAASAQDSVNYPITFILRLESQVRSDEIFMIRVQGYCSQQPNPTECQRIEVEQEITRRAESARSK